MKSRKNLLFLFCFSIVCFTSCHKSGVDPTGENLVLTPVEMQEVKADNEFTLRLFKNLDSANTSGVNLFASPLSVSFALGMTSNGAAGQTLTAMMNTLNFNGFSLDQVNTYYNNLITNLPKLDPNTSLDIANSLWYSNAFAVLPAFLKTTSTSYNAYVQPLDFSSPASVNTINNWVNTQTKGNISSIIKQIPATARLYLLNAIYFKSGWKEKFDPANTAKQAFYLADNSQVQASFMSNTSLDFKRYDNSEASVFELPYSNSKYSMVIVMPASGTTLQQLIAGIDSTKWQTWMTGLNFTKGPLKMPKFTFSYGTSLNGALTDLGMGNAFSDVANFSGINATVPLVISDVEHKAFVDVDESGATAAAVTSVEIGVGAVAPTPPSVIDHPFLFVIREMNSGLIVFAGTVNNPLLTGS
jgi:serpin B